MDDRDSIQTYARGSPMNSNKTDRRDFLRDGSIAAAGLLAGASVSSAQTQSSKSHHAEHEHHPPAVSEFPRTRAGRGGALGSATDRGKLVSGYRAATEPPIPVVMPDLEKLPWKMKDGVKEFQ